MKTNFKPNRQRGGWALIAFIIVIIIAAVIVWQIVAWAKRCRPREFPEDPTFTSLPVQSKGGPQPAEFATLSRLEDFQAGGFTMCHRLIETSNGVMSVFTHCFVPWNRLDDSNFFAVFPPYTNVPTASYVLQLQMTLDFVHWQNFDDPFTNTLADCSPLTVPMTNSAACYRMKVEPQ